MDSSKGNLDRSSEPHRPSKGDPSALSGASWADAADLVLQNDLARHWSNTFVLLPPPRVGPQVLNKAYSAARGRMSATLPLHNHESAGFIFTFTAGTPSSLVGLIKHEKNSHTSSHQLDTKSNKDPSPSSVSSVICKHEFGA